MLAVLGLDTTAEAVYRAMLAHPQAGVEALAAHLGLSAAQMREALDLLSRLSLLRPSYEHAGELRAVSPDIGMEILMSRQQAELASQQQRVEASRAAAAQLIAEYADLRPAAPHPEIEQLVGLDRIRERLAVLTRDMRAEVMTFAPDGGHSPESIEAARPLDRSLLERGILMRTVYLESVRNNQPTTAYVGWLAEHGAQVRTTPALPTRLIIVDRTTAVIPVNSDDSAAGAVVLTGQGTLTALCSLFEHVWSLAQPLGSPTTRLVGGLNPQEATVIRLLAEGLTDDAIAKRLGVSPRTSRRLATDLMERLGARSRFEAGARAAQQGWLPDIR
ncbi:Erythropoiesis-stimulating protein [Kitasatospora sp. MMS16-BH015]|uniref:helix-turn-helix domain-containing protein n=1 Tax=Kitasatospora sp. MMS16-BH015 TaxID=2018025 RepID=UPI000CA1851D|nr:helix-turn-helix transcriptional regulator [Kitasatospora sp. MMS16-BH015]AUG77696.1 Erythropoiesis-stimulating protein [Kitasatospora sp. MMS16-BH015]